MRREISVNYFTSWNMVMLVAELGSLGICPLRDLTLIQAPRASQWLFAPHFPKLKLRTGSDATPEFQETAAEVPLA